MGNELTYIHVFLFEKCLKKVDEVSKAILIQVFIYFCYLVITIKTILGKKALRLTQATRCHVFLYSYNGGGRKGIHTPYLGGIAINFSGAQNLAPPTKSSKGILERHRVSVRAYCLSSFSNHVGLLFVLKWILRTSMVSIN